MELKNIRKNIAKIRGEIEAVKGALPPVAEIEQRVRAWLDDLVTPKQNIVDRLSGCFSRGENVGFLFELPQRSLINAGIGLALAAIGVDEMVKAAMEKAAQEDNGALRMTAAERDERLTGLLRDLYALEFDEENNLNGEPRREDIYFPAAVLQIPLEIAASAGLLK